MDSFPGLERFSAKWKKEFKEQRYICRNPTERSVIIGDSIVKNFSRGKSLPLFENYFKDCINLGIGGDKVANVLWRVKNNGIPKNINDVIILVGTNNISSGHSPYAIAESIINLAEATLSSSTVLGDVYISSILPRYDGYTKEISVLNEHLAFLCSEMGFNFVQHTLNEKNLFCSDGLHLQSRGYDVLGKSFQKSFLPRSPDVKVNKKVYETSTTTIGHVLDIPDCDYVHIPPVVDEIPIIPQSSSKLGKTKRLRNNTDFNQKNMIKKEGYQEMDNDVLDNNNNNNNNSNTIGKKGIVGGSYRYKYFSGFIIYFCLFLALFSGSCLSSVSDPHVLSVRTDVHFIFIVMRTVPVKCNDYNLIYNVSSHIMITSVINKASHPTFYRFYLEMPKHFEKTHLTICSDSEVVMQSLCLCPNVSTCIFFPMRSYNVFHIFTVFSLFVIAITYFLLSHLKSCTRRKSCIPTERRHTTKSLQIKIFKIILFNILFQIAIFDESCFKFKRVTKAHAYNLFFSQVSCRINKSRNSRVVFKHKMQFTKIKNLKFYLFVKLILSGDIELNPGPTYSNKNKDITDWQEHYRKRKEELSKDNGWLKFVEYYSFEDADLCLPGSFWNKVVRLNIRLKGLRSKKRDEELEKPFNLPVKSSEVGVGPSLREFILLEAQKQSFKDKSHELKIKNNQLKRKVDLAARLETDYQNELENVRNLRKELAEEMKTKKIAQINLQVMKVKFHSVQKSLHKSLLKINELETENVNMSKQLESVPFSENNSSVIALNKNIKELQENLDKTLCKVEDLKLDKQRLRNNVNKLHSKLKLCKGKDIIKFEREYDNLLKDFLELQKEHNELDQVIDIVNSEEVVTFQNGRFTNEIRRTVMELVSLNVSINKISEVIKVVLGTLTNTNTSNLRLPSDGARKKIVEEALMLAQMQVAEAMMENEDETLGNCLHGDGSTKYSRHYQNFQITTKSGRALSFGMSEVVDADAEATLHAFITTVEDVCDVISDIGDNKEKKFAELVTSIKNTMSDQGPVNPLFNSKLSILRSELMPKVVENWDDLDNSKKVELNRMGNFFCKLHLLSNFAEKTDTFLKEFESIMLHDEYEKQFAFKTKESSPAQLVRLACKAFHPRGSDKCGVASHFNAYLSKDGIKNKLASFIGNRFNILYYNASILYFLKDKITGFLLGWPEPNGLLKSVDELMRNPFNMACVRALGIVDKIVTAPFWRIVEHPDMTILKMNPYLKTLKHELISLSRNAAPVLLNDFFIFKGDNVEINKNDVFEKLFENTGNEEFEVMTCQALEQIFSSLLVILERQASDQLEGGVYSRPTEDVENSASNVVAHNKISESEFGGIGYLINIKPSAHVETLQTINMLHRNKTMEWINKKSEVEREELMDKARKVSDKMKMKYNERREALMKRKIEIVEERQNIKKENEKKAALKKTEAVNALIKNNVMSWITKESAIAGMESITGENKRLEVVNVQLQFYKHVILCDRKCPHTYFTKSEKGVKLSFDELFEKLLHVIKFTGLPDVLPNKTDKKLKPVTERNILLNDQKEKLQKLFFNNRLTREIERRNNIVIPLLKENPALLVNCNVKHKLKELKDSDEVWCYGKVVGIDKYNTNGRNTSYIVEYFDDPENHYIFPLIADMEKKDCFALDGFDFSDVGHP